MTTQTQIEASPQIIFTVNGETVKNPHSAMIIEKIMVLDPEIQDSGGNIFRQHYKVFSSVEEANSFFAAEGISSIAAVVLEDSIEAGKSFRSLRRPDSAAGSALDWRCGARWQVLIGILPNEGRIQGCATQIHANYGKNFSANARRNILPRLRQLKPLVSAHSNGGHRSGRSSWGIDGHTIW